MLTKYLQAALRHARYEILPDDGHYYGEISECRGVYASAETLEACRDQLAEVWEERVLFRLHRQLPLPVIEGVELAIKNAAVSCQSSHPTTGGCTSVSASCCLSERTGIDAATPVG